MSEHVPAKQWKNWKQEKKVSMQEGVQGAHGSSWKKENWAKNKDRTPLIGQV
jgi:hypothetical protein